MRCILHLGIATRQLAFPSEDPSSPSRVGIEFVAVERDLLLGVLVVEAPLPSAADLREVVFERGLEPVFRFGFRPAPVVTEPGFR